MFLEVKAPGRRPNRFAHARDRLTSPGHLLNGSRLTLAPAWARKTSYQVCAHWAASG